jgi:hypothetical protein
MGDRNARCERPNSEGTVDHGPGTALHSFRVMTIEVPSLLHTQHDGERGINHIKLPQSTAHGAKTAAV